MVQEKEYRSRTINNLPMRFVEDFRLQSQNIMKDRNANVEYW
jgi:hypothetical protein